MSGAVLPIAWSTPIVSRMQRRGRPAHGKVFVMSRERRRLLPAEESPAEPGRYGCPMLRRGRRPHPLDPSRPFWLCALGWSLRGELDVANCIATESVIDCWKVHPERKPIVALPAHAPGKHKASAD